MGLYNVWQSGHVIRMRLFNHFQSMMVIIASAEVTLFSSAASTWTHGHSHNCIKSSLMNSIECSMAVVSQKRVCSMMAFRFCIKAKVSQLGEKRACRWQNAPAKAS